LVHLRLDGIAGESTRKDHKGEIELTSWSWGVAASTGGGTGSARGKAQPGELVFTHVYDKASPILANRCASGTRVATGTLSQRRSGDKQKDYLVIVLRDVLVTSCRTAWTEGGDVVEQVSLTYAEIDVSYAPQDDKGRLGSRVTFGWNVKTGKVT
jgi:type VI secretion system secreted protein Hcp